jgi:hypothetical protein
MGLGEKMAQRVAEELGYDKVLDILNTDVYHVMKVDGISFQKADKMALNYFSYDVNDKRRQKALLYNLLDGQKNLGHTFLPVVKMEAAMKKQNITSASLLEEAVASGDLILDDNRVYTRKLFTAEVGCAFLLKQRFPKIQEKEGKEKENAIK